MRANRLKHLYIDELKDIYSAENQMVKALPKMAQAASSEDLKDGFAAHLEETREHVARLEKIFKGLGESPKGKKCAGMEGLIDEGAEMIEQGLPSEELDAGLISAAQRVEHYEIAAYGCVSAYAKLLGEDQALMLLRHTLQEEKDTDKKLSALSDHINIAAIESGEGNGEPAPSKKNGAMKSRAARA
jgi:ferritin-like metal-binding protein YciE